MGVISLRDAVARYGAEERAPLSAYDWYRRSAHDSWTVSIGGLNLPVRKIGRSWYIEEHDLERGLAAHRAWRAEIARATEDYERGVLHGRSGDTITTERGGYRRRDPFHFIWDDDEVGRHGSDGTWYCNSCMRPAETEGHIHDSEWRFDWVVTRVFCSACGTELRSGLS